MIQLAFNSCLVALLCVPAVTLLSRRWRRARGLASLFLLLATLAGGAVGAACLQRGESVALDLSRFAPVPFALTVDRLGGFFVFLICAIAAPAVLYSSSYVERHYDGLRRTAMWWLLPWFVLSMVVVVTASTGFAFLFGWELMTVLSAGLIVLDGDSEERRHSLFVYLLMMHAGAAAVFGAFLLFLPHAAGLDFATMRAAVSLISPRCRTAIFLLAVVGFGTKAGIVPLHLWLPKAHPIAPSPVSALMSGVMLKTAVYGLIRFGFDFLGTGPTWWGYLILAAGALSSVLGILYALAEHDLKRLLAYSSVENIGIIFLGLGAAFVFASQGAPSWAALALCAALLHTLNHAIFKSLLFLGAGAISDATHSLNLEELGGLWRRLPVTGTAFLIGCCSIIGLPLCNGFVGEWLTFRASAAGTALASVPAAIVLPMTTGVLALTGGLAATCFAKVYGVAFLGRARSDAAEQATEVPVPMRAAMGILAAACVVIGVLPGLVLGPIGMVAQGLLSGATMPEEVNRFAQVLPWLAIGIAALILGMVALRRTARTTPTWACGLPRLDRRMQYTSTAFSKPLRTVFARVYRPERVLESVPVERPYFPASISYRSKRTTSFERALYRPAVEAIVFTGTQLRRLQTGNIQVYLLYIFLALVGLLFCMRFA